MRITRNMSAVLFLIVNILVMFSGVLNYLNRTSRIDYLLGLALFVGVVATFIYIYETKNEK